MPNGTLAAPAAPAERGPGSSEDERKALLQLVALFDLYPGATGLSHLMGLVIRDAVQGREARAQIAELEQGLDALGVPRREVSGA